MRKGTMEGTLLLSNTGSLKHHCHEIITKKSTNCSSYSTAKLESNQQDTKGDCTEHTVPKLWPHRRVIAQSTRCQSYGHTERWLHNVHGAKAMTIQKPTVKSPTTVPNAGSTQNSKLHKSLKTLHPHASCATADTLQTTKAAWSTVI
jgi:hypothetical protein